MGSEESCPQEFLKLLGLGSDLQEGKAQNHYEKLGYFQTRLIEGKEPSRQLQRQCLIKQNQKFLDACQAMDSKADLSREIDQRECVEKTRKYPYSAIGMFSAQFNGQTMYGTGFLIGANVALTAAHNCYYLGQEGKNPFFFPALNRQTGEKFKVKKIYCPKQYKDFEYDEDQNDKFDFALLQLEKNVGQIYGTFGLDFDPNKDASYASLYGYPGQVSINKKRKDGKKRMFGMKGPWKILEDRILYRIFTSLGQSGSPIFVQRNKKYYAIGIHTGGDTQFGYGVALSYRIREFLNKWMAETLLQGEQYPNFEFNEELRPSEAGSVFRGQTQPRSMALFNKDYYQRIQSNSRDQPQPRSMALFNKDYYQRIQSNSRDQPQPRSMALFNKDYYQRIQSNSRGQPQPRSMALFNKDYYQRIQSNSRDQPQPRSMALFNEDYYQRIQNLPLSNSRSELSNNKSVLSSSEAASISIQ